MNIIFETSEEELINSEEKNIIGIRNGVIDHLLKFHTRDGYTNEKERGSCDVFLLDNAVIVTGKHPFGSCLPEYRTAMIYDRKAEEIENDTDSDISEKEKQVNALLSEYIRVCILPETEDCPPVKCDICGAILYSSDDRFTVRDGEEKELTECRSCYEDSMTDGDATSCEKCLQIFLSKNLKINPKNGAQEICPYCGEVWCD